VKPKVEIKAKDSSILNFKLLLVVNYLQTTQHAHTNGQLIVSWMVRINHKSKEHVHGREVTKVTIKETK